MKERKKVITIRMKSNDIAISLYKKRDKSRVKERRRREDHFLCAIEIEITEEYTPAFTSKSSHEWMRRVWISHRENRDIIVDEATNVKSGRKRETLYLCWDEKRKLCIQRHDTFCRMSFHLEFLRRKMVVVEVFSYSSRNDLREDFLPYCHYICLAWVASAVTIPFSFFIVIVFSSRIFRIFCQQQS